MTISPGLGMRDSQSLESAVLHLRAEEMALQLVKVTTKLLYEPERT